jgi:hypothetical protein
MGEIRMKAILSQDHTLTIWGSAITLPKGTRLELVNRTSSGKDGMWAVESVKLLQQLTGNAHDPIHRYCFVPTELAEIQGP